MRWLHAQAEVTLDFSLSTIPDFKYNNWSILRYYKYHNMPSQVWRYCVFESMVNMDNSNRLA